MKSRNLKYRYKLTKFGERFFTAMFVIVFMLLLLAAAIAESSSIVSLAVVIVAGVIVCLCNFSLKRHGMHL